jgi:hypothetical protein
MKRILLPLLLLYLFGADARGRKFEQLARTPPIGWNS